MPARRFPTILFFIAPISFTALLAFCIFKSANTEGDSLWLLKSVYKIKSDIDHIAYPLGTLYLHFPLFQHLTGLAMAYVVTDSDSVLRGWAILSGIAFLASIPLTFFTVKKLVDLPSAILATLIFLASPLIWYSNSTFGESVAAFVTLLYTAALLLRWPWLPLVFLFWCAGITKEVAFPFLAAFWMMAIFFHPVPRPVRARQFFPLLLAILLTLITNIGFNYYRFGDWRTEHSYAGALPLFSREHIDFFLALWFSPNGGLCFFLFPFMAAFFYVLFYPFRPRRAARPILCLFLILLGLTLGFGAWYSPFGWWSWGPRLLIPWIPSLLLLLFALYPALWQSTLRALAARWWALWLIALPLSVASIPHVIAFYDRRPYFNFFDPAKTPGFPPPVHPEIPGFDHFPMMHFLTWQRPSVLLDTFAYLHKPIILALASLAVGTILSLFAYLWFRQKTSQSPHPPLHYASTMSP